MIQLTHDEIYNVFTEIAQIANPEGVDRIADFTKTINELLKVKQEPKSKTDEVLAETTSRLAGAYRALGELQDRTSPKDWRETYAKDVLQYRDSNPIN